MFFDFDDAHAPSLADIMSRVAADGGLNRSRRRSILSRLRQLHRWDASVNRLIVARDPARIPFTKAYVEGLARRLGPAVLAGSGKHVSLKTIKNAVSEWRFLLRRYGDGTYETWSALSPEWKALEAVIGSVFERMQVKRLIHFAASQGLYPMAVTAEIVEPFIAAVDRDVRVKDKAMTARRALRAWNKLADRYPDLWPQVRLFMPKRRQIWGHRWSVVPDLKRAIDDFLDPPLPGRLFTGKRRRKLKPSTIRTQKEALRCYVSALINDGVPPASLVDLRSICTSEIYMRGISLLEQRAGGVTHWVEKAARVVAKLAKYGDVVTDADVARVKKLHQEVNMAYQEWCKTQVDRDQQLLDALDDPSLMDALLALPTRTREAVEKSGKRTVGNGYALQRAVALELGLCSALRNVNLLGLRRGHFSRLEVDGEEFMVVRVAGHETKNGEDTEHFLHEDAASLLTLYLENYLELISGGPTEWLFPGMAAPCKTQQTFRVQMRTYIEKHLKLERFHPHVIRKIVAKLALDADPTAIEVVRRVGGWKTDKALKKFYLQKRHRAAQARYLKMLEQRRLKAFRRLPTERRPRDGS